MSRLSRRLCRFFNSIYRSTTSREFNRNLHRTLRITHFSPSSFSNSSLYCPLLPFRRFFALAPVSLFLSFGFVERKGEIRKRERKIPTDKERRLVARVFGIHSIAERRIYYYILTLKTQILLHDRSYTPIDLLEQQHRSSSVALSICLFSSSPFPHVHVHTYTHTYTHIRIHSIHLSDTHKHLSRYFSSIAPH